MSGAGPDQDPARITFCMFKEHIRQVREKKIETAPDSATRVHIGHPATTPRLLQDLRQKPQNPPAPFLE
jgi:hypothetical protein